MDLLRSTIESFYYRFPLDSVARVIATGKGEEQLPGLLDEVVKWSNTEFTKSEIDLLGNILRNDWLCDATFNINGSNTTFLGRILLLGNQFASKILNYDVNGYPTVKFDNLLRWRSLSLAVGEDLLTVPYMAREDTIRNRQRADFCWPNVLNHDNFRLNAILDEELSDTHSHINAAQDVFEFNWICAMNNPRVAGNAKNSLKRNFLADGPMMEYDLVGRSGVLKYTIEDWIVIASSIRVALYELLLSGRMDGKFHHEIKVALRDKSEVGKLLEDVVKRIQTFTDNALKLSDSDLFFDYAIAASDFVDDIPATPYMIHHGERKFIYNWFSKFYGGNERVRSYDSLMTLYLLIKGKVRREFIQTNRLLGFENFQQYQGSKMLFSSAKHYAEALFRYAVQTSIGDKVPHYLEARMTPDAISGFRSIDFRKAIFGSNEALKVECQQKVNFVVHLIKKPDRVHADDVIVRHSQLRNTIVQNAITIKSEFQRNAIGNFPKVVGIDAASSELDCRPEVFAPVFRYVRFHGLSNFTFHAGEDFYDIVDGLRTISEIIDFADFGYGSRIGHGLALGTESKGFYTSRHFTVLIPRQVLLDNIVWLKYRALSANISLSAETIYFIEKHFTELALALGYSDISNSFYEYYLSMLMRGNDVEFLPKDEVLPQDVLESPVSPDDANGKIKQLWNFYERDSKCRKEGAKAVMVTFPKSFAEDVAKIQEDLLNEIERRGVVVETNPSSNIKIGRFNRYDEHPITRFHSVKPGEMGHTIAVSINTDDKGVFATSLRNEYSLIALALRKKKDADGNLQYNDLEIEEYLRRIARYGNISRFK